MAVVAAAGEEEVEEHEQQEWWFVVVVVESAVLPLPLPDALGVALSGKTTREEEEHDMARGAAAHWRLCCFGGDK